MIPLIGLKNDLAVFQDDLQRVASQTGLSYELLCAQALQESSWKLTAYRYEPNYDRRYCSSPRGRAIWVAHPAFLRVGPSALEWFAGHPERAREQSPGRDYGFVAQTRIAASYGPFQVMFPTACGLGFRGMPEDMYLSSNIGLGPKLLAGLVKKARARGLGEQDSLAVALAQYNGGNALGRNDDPRKLANIMYVRAVGRQFKLCWGRELFS